MTIVYFKDDSEALAHYGIKGMKWGVRRYQNEDGSYTEAGKKRYGSDSKITNKQMRHRIKDAKKINRSNGGQGKYTGAQSRQIYEKYTTELSRLYNDTRNTKLDDKLAEAQEDYTIAEDFVRRLENDNSDDPAAKAKYRKAVSSLNRAEQRLKSAAQNVIKNENTYIKKQNALAAKYIDANKAAIASELGFNNINAGKKAIENASFMNKARLHLIGEEDPRSLDEWVQYKPY